LYNRKNWCQFLSSTYFSVQLIVQHNNWFSIDFLKLLSNWPAVSVFGSFSAAGHLIRLERRNRKIEIKVIYTVTSFKYVRVIFTLEFGLKFNWGWITVKKVISFETTKSSYRKQLKIFLLGDFFCFLCWPCCWRCFCWIFWLVFWPILFIWGFFY